MSPDEAMNRARPRGRGSISSAAPACPVACGSGIERSSASAIHPISNTGTINTIETPINIQRLFDAHADGCSE